MADAYPIYIANRPERSDRTAAVSEKVSGTEFARVSLADPAAIERAIAGCLAGAGPMRDLAGYQRRTVLEFVVQELRRRAEEFAQVMCLEAGKPIRDSRTEVARAIDTFSIAAEESTSARGEILPLDRTARSAGLTAYTQRVPIGPCSFITPFNFPLNLVAHKVAPALACGCPFVLKPAPQTPVCALLLGEILSQADLPAGAFSIVPCDLADATPLVEDPRLKLLSFTGSAAVGWNLKTRAGKKNVLLELGGNAACIVDDGVDLERVADRLVFGAFYQSGQSCISVQRAIVHSRIYKPLVNLLIERARALRWGDPRDEQTFLGPLISQRDADRLREWIDEALNHGAKLLCGGTVHQGVFMEATVLEQVPSNVRLWQEEAFGPVMTIEPFDDFTAACQRVNDSRYGLQAGVFTNDLRRARMAWDTLEVGAVVINDVPSIRADAMPYGGVKDSGLGREGVRYAILEMTELRTMFVNGNVR
jgi:acyl-CoA reductase-like NAD-dependent aldehyde dehydrogenase